MLYTIYKVLYPGLEQIDQYYKWKIDFPETNYLKENRAGPPRKIRGSADCPGCGRRLSYNQIYTDQHKCPGTLTDKPVAPSRNKKIYRTRENDAKLKEYVAKLPHKVQFSD